MVKAITIYICVVAAVAGLWALGSRQYFSFYGSPVPKPESGELVPIGVNHNKTVFITHRQDRIIIIGNAVAIGVVGVSLTGLFLLPVKRKTSHVFQRPEPLALAVPLSRFTPRVGGGSVLVVDIVDTHHDFMPQDSTVTIHGGKWQRAHIEDSVADCFGRVWRRERWVRRDALIEPGGKSQRLFTGQRYNPEHFDLVRGGWSHDHCKICWWDLFETTDESHSIGYTDGKDWICAECYHQFIEIRDEKRDT